MTTSLEDRLRATLQTKAAQLEPCDEQLEVSAQKRKPRSTIWIVAAAAAVLVVVVAAVVAIERDETVSTDEPPPAPQTSPVDPFDEIVGFLPTDGIPAGWVMTQAAFTWTPVLPGGPVTQLFAPLGATVPFTRAVLVTSQQHPERPAQVKDGDGWPPTPTLPPSSPGADQTSVPTSAEVSLPAVADPNAEVRGEPASVVTGPEGGLPAGGVAVSWLSGGVRHAAESVGMTADEVLSFLESVVGRADPAAGFDAPPLAGLVELESEHGYAERRDFYATFEPPGTHPASPVPSIFIVVSKGSDDLHRRFKASVDEDGDVVIRTDLPEQAYRSVFELRADGWTVGVSTNETDVTMETLDAIRRGVVPVTGRQLLDDAAALPVLDELDVAGQQVATRGVAGRARAICIEAGDSQRCGLASEDPSGDQVAWILTNDGWLVVAIGTANTSVEIWGPGDDDDLVPPATRAVAAGREWMIADVPEDAWHVIASPSSSRVAWMRPIPPALALTPATSGPSGSSGATVARVPYFSTANGFVLLVDDGYDSVTAVDLDQSIASRRVVEGQRAGDQPYRLFRSGNDLIVGWGEIFAAPLDGGPSRLLGSATIAIPAVEPNRTWLVTWSGRRIGVGTGSVSLVATDSGAVLLEDDGPANTSALPEVAIPGGMVFVDDNSNAMLWQADTDSIVATLPNAHPLASSATTLAWCSDPCSEVHLTDIETGADQVASVDGSILAASFSPDGSSLALSSRGEVSVLDLTTAAVTSLSDGGPATVGWSPDGTHLYFLQHSGMLGRHDVKTSLTEIRELPGVSPSSIRSGLVVLRREEAGAFLPKSEGTSSECPPSTIVRAAAPRSAASRSDSYWLSNCAGSR